MDFGVGTAASFCPTLTSLFAPPSGLFVARGNSFGCMVATFVCETGVVDAEVICAGATELPLVLIPPLVIAAV